MTLFLAGFLGGMVGGATVAAGICVCVFMSICAEDKTRLRHLSECDDAEPDPLFQPLAEDDGRYASGSHNPAFSSAAYHKD